MSVLCKNGSCVITTRQLLQGARIHRQGGSRERAGSRYRRALLGINATNTNKSREDAWRKNMQMRMHGNQSENILSQFDPCDRSS
eukprot:2292040-Pleurochrysis_carterae.AAC.2